MQKHNESKGLGVRFVPIMGLVAMVMASVVCLPAQTVEERLAALEARIRQLESELATARAAQPLALDSPVAGTEGAVIGVNGADARSARSFIRPAVLVTSSENSELSASAEVAESAVAAAPPQQDTLGGQLEGINFFSGVKFSGFLDAYYGFDFNEPADGKVTFRNFDFNHNSLTLSQVTFDVTKAVSESSPLGYMLQLDFGPTANWVNTGDFGIDNSTAAHFLQYYLSGRVPVGRGLTLDVGKFVTQHGAEVIDTRADWNYSRSLLFAWAIPYYHFGLRATYPASDKVTLAAYLVNGWNNVLDTNGGKTGGFQFVWNPTSRFSFLQNYMLGPEQAGNSDDVRHLFDSLITVKLHDKITFMTNFDYGWDRVKGDHAHWIGTANYLKFQVTDTFALIPRFEFYNDPQGFTTGTRQQLKEFTITPEFLINENLVTRFEYRHDWSNAATFSVSDPDDNPRKQHTVGVGMILKF